MDTVDENDNISAIVDHRPTVQSLTTANFHALCNDLALFETAISPSADPIEWGTLNTKHTLKIGDGLLGSQLGVATFGHIIVYQRVAVYIFACLKHFLSSNWSFDVHELFSKLRDTMESWKALNKVQCITVHQTIGDYLRHVIESGHQLGALPPQTPTERLFLIDSIALDAHLLSILHDRDMYKDLRARRDQDTQSILNILQERLDFTIDPPFKHRHTSALIKLSRDSGLYPQCIVLKGIEFIGEHAVTAGGFGEVWKGRLQGQIVAVKVLKVYETSDMQKLLKEFSCEAVIWRQLQHPNVLQFYGVFHPDQGRTRLCLISPWMDNGNIVQFLDQSPTANCILLIMDIAHGLSYLHSLRPCIVHGDLKGVNILITPSGRACLADFGVSTAAESKAIFAITTVRPRGTVRWQAPELLDPGLTGDMHNSVFSDVYAFACVCYEIFSSEVPFQQTPHDMAVVLAVSRGQRPARPSHNLAISRGLNDIIWDLIEVCWNQDPAKRLPASQVVECIRALPNLPSDQRPNDNIADRIDLAPSYGLPPTRILAQSNYSTSTPGWLSTSHYDFSYAQSLSSTEAQPARTNPDESSSPQSSNSVFSLALTDDLLFHSSLSIMHTAILPNLKLLADEVLTRVNTDISPWKTPAKYIDAEANHVDTVIQEICALTGRVEIKQTNFIGQPMIYSRLIVYIFAHLMLCSSNKSLLDPFIKSLQLWKTWDIVTKVQNYQLIKDYLQGLYQQLHTSQVYLSAHFESTFQKLLTLDTIALSAHLAVIITTDHKYDDVLSKTGVGAQSLLNLLQARLNISIDLKYKSHHIQALIRLSKQSGLVPECLVLKGVQVDGDPVAGGDFADIYKGKFQKQDISLKSFKVFKVSDTQKLLQHFSCEAVTWHQLDHSNILPFYGVCHIGRNPPRVCLVSPWLDNGNVVQYLAKQAPSTDCVPLCLDVAQGLEYLHGEDIIHGNITGLNILITKSGRACLAGFGHATRDDWGTMPTTNSTMSTSSIRVSVRLMAPELIPNMQGDTGDDMEPHNTMATDVYAFALVCYEMFSGSYPFPDITSDFQVMFAVKRGERPFRPTHDLSRARGLNDEVWHIINACWNQEPGKRPTAGMAVEYLRNLPDRPDDYRPLNDFDRALPSQVLSSDRIDHPFSTLKLNHGDAIEMSELKWISRDVGA